VVIPLIHPLRLSRTIGAYVGSSNGSNQTTMASYAVDCKCWYNVGMTRLGINIWFVAIGKNTDADFTEVMKLICDCDFCRQFCMGYHEQSEYFPSLESLDRPVSPLSRLLQMDCW